MGDLILLDDSTGGFVSRAKAEMGTAKQAVGNSTAVVDLEDDPLDTASVEEMQFEIV